MLVRRKIPNDFPYFVCLLGPEAARRPRSERSDPKKCVPWSAAGLPAGSVSIRFVVRGGPAGRLGIEIAPGADRLGDETVIGRVPGIKKISCGKLVPTSSYG